MRWLGQRSERGSWWPLRIRRGKSGCRGTNPNDGRLLPGISERTVRRIVPQAGDGLGQEGSVAVASRTYGRLGFRCRANHWVGQLSPRPKPEPALDSCVHRRSVRHSGKHRGSQVEDDSDDVQDPSVRSQVDTSQQDGRQSDGLDAGGQRLSNGHSPCSSGASGSGLSEGTDPVHSGRPIRVEQAMVTGADRHERSRRLTF